MGHARFRERCTNGCSLTYGHSYQHYRSGSYFKVTIDRDEVRSTGDPINYERCFDETHQGPPYREGGPLDVWNSSNAYWTVSGLCSKVIGSFYANGWYSSYNGGFVPATSQSLAGNWSGVGLSGEYSGSWGDQSSRGATAWNRFKPKMSSADLGIFIGEIRDVPRMLRTTAKGFHDIWKSMGGHRTNFGPKKVADHWLNTQFGWAPFLNDLRKFKRTYEESDKRYKQLVRDNGRWIKRGGSVYSTTSSRVVGTSQVTHMCFPSIPGALLKIGTGNQTCEITEDSYSRAWFEGRFRYWIPSYSGPTFSPSLNDYLRLYGARISPSLVWELTPWSWLIDWGTNVGDVISNLDSVLYDRMAAKYAYLMATSGISWTQRSQVKFYDNTEVHPEFHSFFERKSRCGATPFGFGLSWEGFTPWQMSILGSLGISRLH